MIDDFTRHCVEIFAPLGQVKARAMFGGAGVYCDGQIFAITVDGMLYFKTDELTRPSFRDLGLGPFIYRAKGEPMEMSYWQAPEHIFEDHEAALDWAREALTCGLRASVTKRSPRRRSGRTEDTRDGRREG